MKLKLPNALGTITILMFIVAFATHFISPGAYEMQTVEGISKPVAVAGTFHAVEANPQGITDIPRALIQGFNDGIDIILYVLIATGLITLVEHTGAMSSGVYALSKKMHGREKLIIPILMALFAIAGTSFGFAEELLALIVVIAPMLAMLGFDRFTQIATPVIGAGLGVLSSTINPFSTVIASDTLGINPMEGLAFRLTLLVSLYIVSVWYILRNAKMSEPTIEHDGDKLSLRHSLILLVFAATLGYMGYGLSVLGWWTDDMITLFLASATVIAIIGRVGFSKTFDVFTDGMGTAIGVAMVIALCRGLTILMNDGQMTGAILNSAEQALNGASSIFFINGVFFVESLLAFLIPSTSGLAVLTMSILGPLADFIHVDRSAVVTAYQAGVGIVNLVTPTSAVVMGCLAFCHTSLSEWIKYIWRLMAIYIVIICAVLTYSVM
ncbi:YfcC family protein [Vibrio sp. SS-MA-C1-2]|uniref:YfcC family protein n=1 Tax=Vibrio sp. SS-MA-C1-2 TaxID=2908646 RepID=UPI001F41A1A1|nr:YfcC family protein [Vibrio sp. SS-MA-C1-2]UJF17582.1 YfcC family protein [Vibrio sp. SS-MA-C1-2]